MSPRWNDRLPPRSDADRLAAILDEARGADMPPAALLLAALKGLIGEGLTISETDWGRVRFGEARQFTLTTTEEEL